MIDAIDLRSQRCGAPLKLAPGSPALTCPYCGATMLLPTPPPAPSANLSSVGVSGPDLEDTEDDPEEWGYERRRVGPGSPIGPGIVLVFFGFAFALLAPANSARSSSCSDNGVLAPCGQMASRVDGVALALIVIGFLLIALGVVPVRRYYAELDGTSTA